LTMFSVGAIIFLAIGSLMKLRLRGSPFFDYYDFDLWLMPRPDADNAAVGKYDFKVLPQVYCLRLFCYPENKKSLQ